MRCTNKRSFKRIIAIFILAAFGICSTGCGSNKYAMAYQMDSEVSSFNVLSFNDGNKVTPFAEDLCVVTEDVSNSEELDMSQIDSAILFDLNNKNVLYSKNAHARMSPASLTKIMTALVAIKYGSSEQVLTATDAVLIKESGTQVCGLKSGDTMTMDQALHILLMYSANDVALLIAENVGGSVEDFVDLMNKEAARLGATNTHFVNPHGLTEEEHYTTAYDLYLIFNEAIQYESINEIIHMSNYQTTYYDKNGRAKELKVKNTNGFLSGNANAKAPENVTVIGGKTGTTKDAGNCLILLSKDVNGAPYISIILKAQSSDALYLSMSDLLKEITK